MDRLINDWLVDGRSVDNLINRSVDHLINVYSSVDQSVGEPVHVF